MANDSVVARIDSANQQLPSAIAILDELGGQIMRTSALLRAAINTGADDREDEAYLVGLAHDQIESARNQYLQWAGAPETEQ